MIVLGMMILNIIVKYIPSLYLMLSLSGVALQGNQGISWGTKGYPGEPRDILGNQGVSRGTKGYPGEPRGGIQGNQRVSRGNKGYPGEPRGIQGNHGVFRGTKWYPGEPWVIHGNIGVSRVSFPRDIQEKLCESSCETSVFLGKPWVIH